MGTDRGIAQIINGDNLNFVLKVWALVECSQNIAAYTAKTIDGDFIHNIYLQSVVKLRKL